MVKEIYLDHASTTKTDEKIVEKVVEILTQQYGNPSSLHRKGLEIAEEIGKATRQIKKALQIRDGKLYYTSGGTEANNTAIFGAAYAGQRRGKTLVTTTMEHSSVADSFALLEKEGFIVKWVSPREDGNTYSEDILKACDEDTILVSAILVNNETGARLDAERLVKSLKKKSPHALLHLDGVQAVGKHFVYPEKLGVDLFTFSGHKIYAPKGIGCLYLAPKVRIKPLLYGGAQQEKIRPGTENTAYIVALGEAVEQAIQRLPEQLEKVTLLHQQLTKQLHQMEGVAINSPEDGSPYILNFSLLGYRSETVLHLLAMSEVYLSAGSACSKGALSHVLKGAGLSAEQIQSALRVSFGKDNTCEDVSRLVLLLKEAQQKLIRK